MPTVDELLVRIDATTEGLRRELARADNALNASATTTQRALDRMQGSHDKLTRAVSANSQTLTHSFRAVLDQMLAGQDAFRALEQQAPRLLGAFGLLNAGFLTTAAAFVGLPVAIATAMNAYSSSTLDLQRQMQLTGNASGFTSRQLQTLAETISETSHITVAAARDAEQGLLEGGRLGGDIFTKLLGITADYAAATKQTTEKASADLARLFSDPAKGAAGLDAKLNILKGGEQRQIELAQKAGDVDKARIQLFDALLPRIQNATEKVTALGRAWETVSKPASNFFDKLGQIGDVPPPPDGRFGSLQTVATEDEIRGSRKAEVGADTVGPPIQLFLEARARFREASKGADELAKALDPVRTQTEGLQAAQKLLNALIESGMGDQSQYTALLGRVNVALSNVRDPVQAYVKALNDQASTENLTGVALAKKQALLGAEKAAIEAHRSLTDKDRAAVEGAAETIYRDTQRREANAQAVALATQAAKEEEEARTAASKRTSELLQQRDKINLSLEAEVANNDRLIAALEQGGNAYEREAALIDIQNKFRAIGLPLIDEEIEKYRGLADQLGEQKDRMEQLKGASDALKQAGTNVGQAIGTAFEDAVVNGKGLRDVLQGLEQDIARIILRMAITKPIEGAIGGLFEKGAGSILSSLFGSLLGGGGGSAALGDVFAGSQADGAFGDIDLSLLGARADGGPVEAGVPYTVGERGREIFVPQAPGFIVPNKAIDGGGQTVIVNQTVAIHPDVSAVARAQVVSMLPTISERAKAGVVAAQKRSSIRFT